MVCESDYSSDKAHAPHRRGRLAPGFTLIEVLVVVGIILILIGLFFAGMRMIGKTTGSNATKVNLQRLKGMIAELETTGKLTGRQPATMWISGARYPVPTDPALGFWMNGKPDRAGGPWPISASLDIGDVTIEQWDASKPSDPPDKRTRGRFQSAAVCNTQLAMQYLLQAPNNRRAIEAFGQDGLLRNPEQGKASVSHPISVVPLPGSGGPYLILTNNNPATVANGSITPPIPTDTWQNPIIMVPSAGLDVASGWDAGESYKAGRIVYDGGKYFRALKASTGVPTSNKATWEQTNPPPNMPAGQWIVYSPDHRPFFASAGPDGDFLTIDDNIYSFE